jgi:hypothetical protein
LLQHSSVFSTDLDRRGRPISMISFECDKNGSLVMCGMAYAVHVKSEMKRKTVTLDTMNLTLRIKRKTVSLETMNINLRMCFVYIILPYVVQK